eukprot:SAG11_NODE_6410_length_1319_cov_1.680328_2_plen_85_part_00
MATLQGLTGDELWCILHDVAKGLKHIHDKEFLHLDLKPENIFLTESGLLKIGDFGVTVHAVRLAPPPVRGSSSRGSATAPGLPC